MTMICVWTGARLCCAPSVCLKWSFEGETVVIRTGCGDDFGDTLFWCNVGSAVWNNDGDTVFLLDPNGNTHQTYNYEGVR